METRNHAQMGKALDRALREHDPHLSLVWVKSNIPAWEVPQNVIPGRWHVRRENPHLAASYTAITTPDGGYREPDFGVLQEVQKRDLWTRGVPAPPEDPLKRDRREKTLRDEQRRDEMRSDFQAAKRVAGENVHKRNWGKGGKGVVG